MSRVMVVDEVESAVLGLRGVVDGCEPVDEFSHALQTAGLAIACGADDELVVAALLHDIARSPLLASTGLPHEAAAQAWLIPRLGKRVGWLAGAHVAAKLFLVATAPGYADRLSATSVESCRTQGRPDRAGPVGHIWWADALRLREYDDAAKVPEASLPSMTELLRVVARIALEPV